MSSIVDPIAATPIREPLPLSAPQRGTLLSLARTAIAVGSGALPARCMPEALDAVHGDAIWHRRGAAFVTLFEDRVLRGCMGVLLPGRLPESVVEATFAATLDDPRFEPVSARELRSVELEISVLGPVTPIDDPAQLRPGIDGAAIDVLGRRVLLLPEVATEYGWNGPTLWSALCTKAGLSPEAWQRPDMRLFLFRTIRFGGPAYTPR